MELSRTTTGLTAPGQGYTCNEGACLKQKKKQKPRAAMILDGENVFHKGSVSILIQTYQRPPIIMDGCADEYTVWEAYCSNNADAFKKLDCPEGYRMQGRACQ